MKFLALHSISNIFRNDYASVVLKFNPHPAIIFCPENVCLLRLLYLFKFTPLYFYYERENTMNPDQTAPSSQIWVHIVHNEDNQST